MFTSQDLFAGILGIFAEAQRLDFRKHRLRRDDGRRRSLGEWRLGDRSRKKCMCRGCDNPPAAIDPRKCLDCVRAFKGCGA